MRVYHIDPVRLFEISRSRNRWLIDLLADEIDANEARDLYVAALAASIPNAKRQDREKAMTQLERAFAIKRAKRKPEIIEHNPEKAAAWFAEHGLTVVNTPTESDTT